MCNPVAAAVVMGGAQGVGVLQQAGSARSQNSFQKAQYNQNKEEALRALVESFKGGQTRINQEREATAGALKELTRQATEARGKIKVNATSVSGDAVDALLRDFERQELIRAEVLNTNLANTETEITQGFEVIRSNTRTRINQGFGTPAQVPSLLGAAVQIGSSAFSGYAAAGGFA